MLPGLPFSIGGQYGLGLSIGIRYVTDIIRYAIIAIHRVALLGPNSAAQRIHAIRNAGRIDLYRRPE
jgi:hypothetical protein